MDREIEVSEKLESNLSDSDLHIVKYPRTKHIQGSRIQAGDEDLETVPFDHLLGRYLVVEEKIDGSNTGISFSSNASLLLQSRGHFLTGGPRELQYTIFKRWSAHNEAKLLERIEDRYIIYGEWMAAKHTIFYDKLPHYFMEFDVLDKRQSTKNRLVFLDTKQRLALLEGTPFKPVPVLFSGTIHKLEDLIKMIAKSHFMSSKRMDRLRELAIKHGANPDKVVDETDSSDLMEGIYIKIEEDGVVKERYKFVRTDFVSKLQASGNHWTKRNLIPNLLEDGVDIFEGVYYAPL